jgi:hypothetical protein
MISDVLLDTIAEIENYQSERPKTYNYHKKDLEKLKSSMRKLVRKLHADNLDVLIITTGGSGRFMAVSGVISTCSTLGHESAAKLAAYKIKRYAISKGRFKGPVFIKELRLISSEEVDGDLIQNWNLILSSEEAA